MKDTKQQPLEFLVVTNDDRLPTEEEKEHMRKIESQPGYTEKIAKRLAATKKKYGL